MRPQIYDLTLSGPLWWAAAVVNVAAVAVAAKQILRLNRGSVWRGLKRVSIRAGWPSTARSVGLSVRRDRRTVATGSTGPLWATLSGPIDQPRTNTPAAKEQAVEALPRLRHGRASASKASVSWDVTPAKGASLDDVAAKVDELAAAFDVHQVVLERVTPSRGKLVVVLEDSLARPRPWPGPGAGVGVTSTGDVLNLPWTGGHYLLAGVTGSGKSAWMNALLAELFTSGLPRYVVGVDPKVVELSAWRPALDRLIVDPAEAGEALAAIHHQVTARYRALEQAGLRKLDQPTPEMPLLVLVVDELGELVRQAPGEGKAAPQERLRLLSSLAAIGRGAGLVIIACTQRPTAQLVGADLRSNLTRRVCCKVNDEYGAEAVLGPQSGDLAPWRIPAGSPGTAWVQTEGTTAPVLARSWWVSDADIAGIAAAHPAPRPAELESVKG